MTLLVSQPSVTLQVSEQALVVTGDLEINAAAELAAAGVKWLTAQQPQRISFDFAGVGKASSVALSVLFEWLRTCQQQHIAVESIQLSAPLSRLATLAELDGLIANPSDIH